MTAYKETDTCWHLLCRTYGGKVSIIKNLDAPSARQAYQKLLPRSHPERYLNPPKNGSINWGSGGCFGPSDNAIDRVDILGPEGVELDPWRGVEPHYYDLSQRHQHSNGPIRLTPEEGRKLAAKEDAAQSERTGA